MSATDTSIHVEKDVAVPMRDGARLMQVFKALVEAPLGMIA